MVAVAPSLADIQVVEASCILVVFVLNHMMACECVGAALTKDCVVRIVGGCTAALLLLSDVVPALRFIGYSKAEYRLAMARVDGMSLRIPTRVVCSRVIV